METATVHTLSSTYAARKNRVRYTAYYPNSTQSPKVLFSGSENAYKALSSNFEEMYPVVSGTQLQLSNFIMMHGEHKVIVHRENWTSGFRRQKEPFFCKRAVGDYPTDEMYQAELTPVSFKHSKFEE